MIKSKSVFWKIQEILHMIDTEIMHFGHLRAEKIESDNFGRRGGPKPEATPFQVSLCDLGLFDFRAPKEV